METNTQAQGKETDDPRQTIRRLYADGKVDANTATRELLMLDSRCRRRLTLVPPPPER